MGAALKSAITLRLISKVNRKVDWIFLVMGVAHNRACRRLPAAGGRVRFAAAAVMTTTRCLDVYQKLAIF